MPLATGSRPGRPPALRFTHFQVRYEPERVREVLTDVAARLRLK